jgi:hypothetical protein
MFPSPIARDWKGKGYEGDLNHAVRMFPTPSAEDNRDRGNISNPSIQRKIKLEKQVSLGQVVSPTSGQLNPNWVEWLMGFPIGWTELKDSETQSSLK